MGRGGGGGGGAGGGGGGGRGGAGAKDSFPEGDIFLSVPKTLFLKAIFVCLLPVPKTFPGRRIFFAIAKDSFL